MKTSSSIVKVLWGEGVSSWKWIRVVREAKDKNIKLEEMMTQYFALMHFL